MDSILLITKRVVRKLLLIVLSVAAALAVLLFFLTLAPGERLIARIAERMLSGRLGRDVRVGLLETNIFSRLRVEEVRICGWGEDRETPLLQLGSGAASYRLSGLLSRRLELGTVELDRLSIRIKRDSTGAHNLTVPGGGHGPGGGAAALRLALGRIVLTGASIEYTDASAQPVRAAVDGFGFEAERGTAGSYEFSARFDSVSVMAGASEVVGRGMRLKGGWNGQDVSLDSIGLRLPGLDMSGQVSLALGDARRSLKGSVGIHGNPSPLLEDLRQLLPPYFMPVDGEIGLRFDFDGELPLPTAKVVFAAPRISVGSLEARDVALSATIGRSGLAVEDLDFRTLGGTVSCRGIVVPESLVVRGLHLSFEEIDVGEVRRLAFDSPAPFRARLGGELSAEGPLSEPMKITGSLSMRIHDVSYRERRVPDFNVSAGFREGVAELEFFQGSSRIEASAVLSKREIDGAFSVQIPDLEPIAALLNVPGLKGRLAVGGNLYGNPASPDIMADIRASEITYRGFPVDSLGGRVSYRGGRLYIGEAVFAGGLDPIDTLSPPFGLEDVSGGIVYFGRIEGPIGDPAAELVINLHKPAYRGLGFDAGLIRVELREHRIGITSFRLVAGTLLATGEGEYNLASKHGRFLMELVEPLRRTGAHAPDADAAEGQMVGFRGAAGRGRLIAEFGLVDGRGISMSASGERLDIGSARLFVPSFTGVGGYLDFEADASSADGEFEGSLDFFVAEPRLMDVALDSLGGSLEAGGGRIRLGRFDLFGAGERMRIQGEVAIGRAEGGDYSISRRSATRGSVSAAGIDLHIVDPLLGERARIGGDLGLDIRWDGTIAEPRPAGVITLDRAEAWIGRGERSLRDIRLSASLEDSVIRVERLSGLAGEVPFDFTAEVTRGRGGTYHVDGELLLRDHGRLHVTGIKFPDSLDLTGTVRGMDLSVFQPFLAGFKGISGRLDADVVLRGPTADPGIDGRLGVRDLTLQPIWLDHPLQKGIIELFFDRRNVTVDTLYLDLNGGSITAAGSLSHSGRGLEKIDLRAGVKDVRIDRRKQMILEVVSASMRYRDREGYYLLDGDIVLGETRVLADFKPQSLLPFTKRVERPAAEMPPFLQKTRIDVRLRRSGDIWVDNNIARMRLRAEINVLGGPSKPHLAGRVSVEKGYVLFLDRKFNVVKGTADFADPERLNPIVELEADSRIRSYRGTEATTYNVKLSISGPLDEAVVELTSDPPLEKSSIVSLLTLGVTREELAGGDAEAGEPTIGQLLAERAQSISSQRVSGYISRNVGNLLGLDQLTIEGNLFRFDKSWGPQLVASKRVSERVELTYTTKVGHFNENSIRLDYRLTERFSLDGQTDQQGRAGIDFKYRLRFK